MMQKMKSQNEKTDIFLKTVKDKYIEKASYLNLDATNNISALRLSSLDTNMTRSSIINTKGTLPLERSPLAQLNTKDLNLTNSQS